jgi:hypothetical protein
MVTCVQAPTRLFDNRVAQYLDPDGLGISVAAKTVAADGAVRHR